MYTSISSSDIEFAGCNSD